MAKELNIRVIPRVRKTVYGTPILSDALEQMYKHAKGDYIGYINSDIIFLSDFSTITKHIQTFPHPFIVSSQRYALDVENEIVGKKNWEKTLRKRIKNEFVHPILSSSDYFIFPKTLHLPLPPFALGKLYWDRWFYYYAKKHHIALLDATPSVTAIHQQHYGLKGLHGYDTVKLGREVESNIRLLGGPENAFHIFDCEYYLYPNGIQKKKMTITRIIRTTEIWLHLFSSKHRHVRPLWSLVKYARFLVTSFRQQIQI